jgi:hypothetical protein
MSLHIHYYESDWPKPSINMEIDVPSTTTVDELKEIVRKKIPSVPKGSTEIQATYFTQVRANMTQENKKLLGWTFTMNGTPTYDGSVPLTKYPFWNMKGTRISFTIAPALPKEYYAKQPAKKATNYYSTYENQSATNNNSDEEDSFPYEPAKGAPAPGAGQNSRRRNRNRNRQVPEENSNEEKCRTFLKSKGIESLADFRKKSVQLHPNKGGNLEDYQKISGCVDTLFKKKYGGAHKSRRSRTKKHRKQKTRKQ